MGAELFPADGRRWTDRQTDRHDEAFNYFANAPKNVKLNNIHYLNDYSMRRANKYCYD